MIRQEVIKQLDYLYPDIPIYAEEVTQGFQEPSFYVKVLNGSQKRELNTRYKRTYNLDIHYFGTTNKECEVVADILYEKMEYLLNNMAKGINMHHEVIDKVLHFFVDYNIRIKKEQQSIPKLKDLEVKENGK
ncbi:phage tail terminator family protein [Vallitalea sp.]|jgi:hypothetical protein|uniref:phage tail terminator family protein n=1 Tax=Vallitalea sp. TaxID=1882829 RepID=UPI0025E1347A|nr:hypothetical protein [Vallitalea sp.]MCT4686081.1 hypothetical protein [Vallitalea sp.]